MCSTYCALQNGSYVFKCTNTFILTPLCDADMTFEQFFINATVKKAQTGQNLFKKWICLERQHCALVWPSKHGMTLSQLSPEFDIIGHPKV